jgi:AraC-like DNA-binding protein
MNNFLTAFLVGESFLLCFLLYFHPLKQNAKANKWLSLFAFVLGMIFVGNYLDDFGLSDSYPFIIKWFNSLHFLLAPSLYVSILYFVNPTGKFKIYYWLHFLPSFIFAVIEHLVFWGNESISTKTLFEIGETAVSVRDLLPFQLLAYLFVSYFAIKKHQENLELITSSTQNVNLNWLKLLLLILIFPILFWINDALDIFPFLVNLNRSIYAVSIAFIACSAMKQTAIFPYTNEELDEISEVISEQIKSKRLSNEQISELSTRLDNLMKNDKIFLENEINLATVADKLDISIHDTSYLINEVTGDNFYNFINKFRVEEAKELLTSDKSDKLNMLGIAFESGFNSKTTFNTAFKKLAGISPSEYAKQNKNSDKYVRLDKPERP